MESRFDYPNHSPASYKAMYHLEMTLHDSSIENSLRELVKLRASQLNACAFCIDMHWKDARAAGETEQRLYGLDAWEESPYYTPRERAALAWCEAVTNLHQGHVPDSIYEHAREELSEHEISDLTFVIAIINAWNRLAIAGRSPAGAYEPAGA